MRGVALVRGRNCAYRSRTPWCGLLEATFVMFALRVTVSKSTVAPRGSRLPACGVVVLEVTLVNRGHCGLNPRSFARSDSIGTVRRCHAVQKPKRGASQPLALPGRGSRGSAGEGE